MSQSFSLVTQYVQQLQQRICAALEAEESQQTFLHDRWTRDHAAGESCVLEGGTFLERGGVNYSHVKGDRLPPSASVRYPQLSGAPFEAAGISIVLHPYNPFVPTSHFNIRFFEAQPEHGPAVWWFGGGFDLTPYYGFDEDCVHWHRTAQQACAPFGDEVYPRLKRACDEYFYLKHRQEPRGIGGLFFDDWNEWGFERSFDFFQSIGDHFIPAYLPIVQKRKHHPFEANHRAFQAYRRGRYVEFNLVYDRGTTFGLQSNGRTESILMSMPPMANWRYQWTPEPHSEEEKLYQHFLVPKDWI